MLGRREKYLRMMLIELEDLKDHMESLIQDYRERESRGEVTEHVFRGNVAVLVKEKLGIERLSRIVGEMNPEDYNNLDALASAMTSRFDDASERKGLSKAAQAFAERKMRRVEEYVRDSDWMAHDTSKQMSEAEEEANG